MRRNAQTGEFMKKVIYWAGDSTVKQNDIASYPQSGIGQGFELYIRRDIFVDNRAENGRSTKSFIDEGRLRAIEADIQKGDFLFIQFGHNDEKPDEERHTDPFSSYQTNLTVFAEAALNKGAFPVFITPLYRRLFRENNTLIPNTHLDYPDAMITLGKHLSIPVIDLCEASRMLIEEAGPETTKPWFLHLSKGRYVNYPDGREDNTHLSYEGAVVFAGLIAKELRHLGGIYEELLLPLDVEKEDPALLID